MVQKGTQIDDWATWPNGQLEIEIAWRLSDAECPIPLAEDTVLVGDYMRRGAYKQGRRVLRRQREALAPPT